MHLTIFLYHVLLLEPDWFINDIKPYLFAILTLTMHLLHV